jgi:GNAT superfamily N-acetyltransferase
MPSRLMYIDAVPEDSELLSATAIASKKTWGYADDLMRLWKPDLEVTAAYILENKVVKVFDNETFIGFFALKPIENTAVEIDHLWLTPDSMRRNYGREIFQYIRDYLLSNGYQKAALVAEPNANGFYEKMGGKIIGKFQSRLSGRFLDIFEYQITGQDEK